MAQRGKAINVKVARTKVIKALEETLAKLEKTWEKQQAEDKKFDAEMAEYNKKVAEIAVKNLAKAEDIRVNQRWNGVINVDFNLPAGTAKLPTEPERKRNIELGKYEYENQKREMENAIRILKLSDEEVVSTSTYQAVAQYL
jgi:HEPN domain-containing protein